MKQPLSEFYQKHFWSKDNSACHVLNANEIGVQITRPVWRAVCDRVWYGMAVNLYEHIENR